MKILKLAKAKNKDEKGAISTLVLFTVLMFVIILLGVYYSINAKQKAQLESDLRIQKLYGADADKLDEIYDEQKIKLYELAPTVRIEALSSSIVEDGLIRYYNGRNIGSSTTWKDLTGSYDGIINGATTNSEGGYVSFDGVNDYVNIGQVVNKNAITLEAEFIMNGFNASNSNVIIGNWESGGEGIYTTVAQKVCFEVYIEGLGYKSVTSDEVIETGKMYNVTGTYDGSTIRLYIDGKLAATPNVTSGGKIGNPANNTIMAMGTNPARSAGASGYPNMRLYSARIYDRALSEEEIKQNINGTFKINFSKPIEGLNSNDITVTNASEWTLEGSGTSYTMNVRSIKNNEPLNIKIASENLGKEYTYTYTKPLKSSYETAFEKNYTQINYIESTGTQYIDTGFKPDKNTGIEVDYQFTDTTGQQRIMGVQGLDSDSTSFSYEIYINGSAASGGKLAYAYKDGTGNWASTGITVDTNKHKLKFNVSPYDPSETNNFELDSTKVAIIKSKTVSGTTTNFTFNNTSKVNMFIMARCKTTGEANGYGKLRIYGFNIYERGFLVKQLIPCKRNSDGKPGLYDRINHEFFTNSGTGEFTIGT